MAKTYNRNALVNRVLEITELNNCFLANFRNPYYFNGEFHPFWEMIYVTDGQFQVAGEEKIYTMQKGDIIFHKPMEFHRLWTIDNMDIHAFFVGFCAKGNLLSNLEGGAFVLTKAQQDELGKLIQYVDTTFPCKNNVYLDQMLRNWSENATKVQSFVNAFELFLMSLTENHTPLTVKEIANTDDSQIYQQIVKELSANVYGWITIPEIADKLHFSESQVKRAFAKYSDIGIHKYLLKLKTAAAIRMLGAGMTPGDISRSLGFANQNYFSAAFKRETGVAPTHYASNLPGK